MAAAQTPRFSSSDDAPASRGVTSRAANTQQFAKYMATHNIAAVLDLLVSKLAELQPTDPIRQMRDDLGDVLDLSRDHQDESGATQGRELVEEGGANTSTACRLTLAGTFVDATGQVNPIRVHVAVDRTAFTTVRAREWLGLVDKQMKAVLLGAGRGPVEDPAVNPGWVDAAMGDTADKDGEWRELFNELDAGGTGSVDMDTLEQELQKHQSALIVSESETYQKKLDTGGQLNVEEFSAMMDELRFAALVRFFDSLGLSQVLARLALLRIPASRMSDALEPLAPIVKGARDTRVDFAGLLIQDAVDPLADRISEQLASKEEYRSKQENGDEDKFNTMELVPRYFFDKGLEFLLGAPAKEVLEAMEREHLSGADANDEFEAYNGKLRITTPAKEWNKMLPQSIHGPVNVWTYDDRTRLCDEEDMMLHPMVGKAGLHKYELVALRLYTGPMFKIYNGLLRAIVRRLAKLVEEALQGQTLTAEEEERVKEEAALTARKELARYVNTIHAMNSGLIKIARVTRLPPSGCGYRGLAGLKVPGCFLKADRFGCRGGVEGGFLSASTDKAQAMLYIRHDKGMPQLFIMRFGTINRGATLKWLSSFPNEDEVLLPPLSCLEKVGVSSYESTPDGLVQVTHVGINVNLKGRTIEELQAIRKSLHTQMATNSMNEVSVAVAAARERLGAAAGSPEHALLEAMLGQCEAVLRGYRQRADQDFNDDNTYSSAIQDVLMLLPWAEGLVDLHASGGVVAAELSALQITDHLPSSDLLRTGGKAAARAAAALAVCKQRGLVQGHLEDQDAEGKTALARSAKAGETQEVALLLLSGARTESKDKMGETPLILACGKGLEGTASMLIEKGADVHAANEYGETPLILACSKGLEGTAIMLIEKGADVHAKNKRGETTLILACIKGLKGTASMLIEKGADVHAKNEYGETPLILACRKGLEGTASMLIEKGADVHAKNKRGETTLIAASMEGHESTANMLINKGVDVNAKDEDVSD